MVLSTHRFTHCYRTEAQHPHGSKLISHAWRMRQQTGNTNQIPKATNSPFQQRRNQGSRHRQMWSRTYYPTEFLAHDTRESQLHECMYVQAYQMHVPAQSLPVWYNLSYQSEGSVASDPCAVHDAHGSMPHLAAAGAGNSTNTQPPTLKSSRAKCLWFLYRVTEKWHNPPLTQMFYSSKNKLQGNQKIKNIILSVGNAYHIQWYTHSLFSSCSIQTVEEFCGDVWNAHMRSCWFVWQEESGNISISSFWQPK